MAKIFVTGSTGFIGKRLVHQLLEEGHEVYALVRIRGTGFKEVNHPHLHLIYGDVRDLANMDPLPQGIEVAYYLMHSMGYDVKNLVAAEEEVTQNFIKLLEKTACQQVIFLGGIIEDETKLSPHLRSRLAVEKGLQRGTIPSTILRASLIIGAGSASFEIIRDLVEKIPIMVAPKWVKSSCQPIAIRDVLFYLTQVLLKKECFNQVYDLGGPEAMSFKQALLRYAAFRKLRRVILDVPVLSPRLSCYWLVFITSVRFSICSHLVESMKQNTRKLNQAIDLVLPHECLTYEKALELAFQKIEQNAVISTWMDAWKLEKVGGDIQDFIEVPQEGCLKDYQKMPITISIEEARRNIWSIGGDRGWYSMDWAWEIRGMIDKLVGGTGLNRGRRHPHDLEVGDSIDFWRVLLADEKNKHLILYAEMKLPGEAWLEFRINEEKKILEQIATFRPKGFLGRVYWYSFLPFHWVIFKNMAKVISGEIKGE